MFRTRKTILFAAALMSSVTLVGCGGDSGGYASVEDLAGALDAPSGTVDAASAKGVAAAFAESQNAPAGGFGGEREAIAQKQQAESASQACSGGGSIDAEGDETQVKIKYNQCVESSCTLDGTAQIFAEAAGGYSNCVTYDITGECEGNSIAVSFAGCIGESGTFTYLIQYEGLTYRVEGAYSDGNGTLTITGANGTYTCTYVDDAGSCVDEDGAEFTF